MLPFLLSAALVAAQPSPCTIDIVVAAPRIKVVRAKNRAYDNNIVSVVVTNTGSAPQHADIRQHLELLMGTTVVGSQPIPSLDPKEDYEAAFRFQVKHEKKRTPFKVTLHFVRDSKPVAGESCTTSHDQVTATL